MQDPTRPRTNPLRAGDEAHLDQLAGFDLGDDLNPIDPRIAALLRVAAALEDHLARETRSSQALAARVAELEALCSVLGVVPELPADGEPRFLPLAEVRRGVQVKRAAFSALCDAEGIQ